MVDLRTGPGLGGACSLGVEAIVTPSKLLPWALVLVSAVLAYADLKYKVVDLHGFQQEARQKVQRLEIRVSHLQSWVDELRHDHKQ